MRDIQNEIDNREVPLQKVGIRDLKYPVSVLDKTKKSQNTTATVNLYVNLPHHFKGTHMSRFIEIFHKYHTDITMQHFLEMLEEIRTKLDAERAFGSIEFPYFIEKEAPVSHSKGIMQYKCSYEAEVGESLPLAPAKQLNEQVFASKNLGQRQKTSTVEIPAEAFAATPSNGAHPRNAPEKKFFVGIEIPVTTLCPCSKAISENGAHNQRGTVRIKILYTEFFWIEDVINMVETCASAPLYSVLKRQDEKYVTEQAYSNPRFVEDVVREVYLGLKKFNFKWFSVEAENEESIHFHNAYAYTEYCGE